MRVLIACEESQEVCKAFRELGHEAFSCDILDCSGGHPEWHIKDDVLKHLNDGWDMMIAHPPCTDLAVSGARHFKEKIANGSQQKSIDFFMALINANIPKIAVENPQPHKWATELIGHYDIKVQPWWFGDGYTKSICLWLKNLQKLTETNNVYDYMMTLPVKERERIYHLGGGKSKERSKTYIGIAKAISEQWGNIL